MAIYTCIELIEGKLDISRHYTNACKIWKQIKEGYNFRESIALAEELNKRQSQFEQECGGKWLGQEIMVIVGIGQFWNHHIGFDATLKDVLKVKEAFHLSNCSVEVKGHVEKVCAIFYLKGDVED